MILPPQHSFKLHACSEYLNLATLLLTYSENLLSSVASNPTTYLICYSKTTLKIQATIYPNKTNFLGILAISYKLAYKQVLNFKKLNVMEKNPQTKNQTKRGKSVNK